MIYCSLLLALACQSAEPDTQLDAITSKISEISYAFAELSGELQQVSEDVSKELTVADALESAQQLADSMEELLAMLPAPPPASGSGSPRQQPQGSGSGDQQQLDQLNISLPNRLKRRCEVEYNENQARKRIVIGEFSSQIPDQ